MDVMRGGVIQFWMGVSDFLVGCGNAHLLTLRQKHDMEPDLEVANSLGQELKVNVMFKRVMVLTNTDMLSLMFWAGANGL